MLQHTATCCNTAQHVATKQNVVRRSTTYCNTVRRDVAAPDRRPWVAQASRAHRLHANGCMRCPTSAVLHCHHKCWWCMTRTSDGLRARLDTPLRSALRAAHLMIRPVGLRHREKCRELVRHAVHHAHLHREPFLLFEDLRPEAARPLSMQACTRWRAQAKRTIGSVALLKTVHAARGAESPVACSTVRRPSWNSWSYLDTCQRRQMRPTGSNCRTAVPQGIRQKWSIQRREAQRQAVSGSTHMSVKPDRKGWHSGPPRRNLQKQELMRMLMS